MKLFKKSMFVALGLGAVLFGCKPETVDPNGKTADKDPGLAGVFDSEHPNLDTVCKLADLVRFRSNDGSFLVNVCNDGDVNMFSPSIVPCVGDQAEWGHFAMYNGYEFVEDPNTGAVTDSVHWLDIDFSLAPGVFVTANKWVFTIDGNAIINPNTGLPVVGTDWSQLLVDPARNEWKIRILIAELPQPCFDMACKMSTVQLGIFGDVIAGSEVDLWAINEEWDNVASEAHSVSPYVIHYCPLACLEDEDVTTTSECVRLQTGLPSSVNQCATLDATTAGASYAWSTGATTSSISVCPTANTTYTCSVTLNNKLTVKTYEVKVENVRCGNVNQPQHKVWVCHVPPGNPNNPQDICIDWSGVPAHVARFRVAGQNYRQGHDSGCEIGHCGGNPCN